MQKRLARCKTPTSEHAVVVKATVTPPSIFDRVQSPTNSTPSNDVPMKWGCDGVCFDQHDSTHTSNAPWGGFAAAAPTCWGASVSPSLPLTDSPSLTFSPPVPNRTPAWGRGTTYAVTPELMTEVSNSPDMRSAWDGGNSFSLENVQGGACSPLDNVLEDGAGYVGDYPMMDAMQMQQLQYQMQMQQQQQSAWGGGVVHNQFSLDGEMETTPESVFASPPVGSWGTTVYGS